MARTVRVKVYKFSELSQKAKQNAISHYHDINTDHNWWDGTYDDAATVGLKITGFDIGRGRDITGELEMAPIDSIKAIKENHGEQCDSYQMAVEYEQKYIVLQVRQKLLGEDSEEWYGVQEEIDELDEQYKKSLLATYWKILDNEYDYLISDEAIIETIEANEYEFTQDGERFYQKKVA